jgi:hypothetical protein
MATEAAQLKGKEPTEVKTVLTLTGLLMEGVEAVSKTAHSSPARDALRDFHSTMIRSAHSTSETKIAGLPNFAPH